MALCDSLLKSNSVKEPIEVRQLKKQLANVKCNCLSCGKCRDPPPSHVNLSVTDPIEKDVQTELKVFADQNTEMDIRRNLKDNKLIRDLLCPSCLILTNIILNGEKRKPIVLKDEESFIKPYMWSSDKSVDNTVLYFEKPTSYLESIATSCVNIFNRASQVTSTSDFNGNTKKCLGQGVTFEGCPKEVKIRRSECDCMDKFLRVVRPPLGDWVTKRNQFW